MQAATLEKMISSWQDNAIQPAENAELIQSLRADVESRRLYLEYMSIHAELCSLESSEEYFASLDALNDRSEDAVGSPNQVKDHQDTAAQQRASAGRNWWPLAVAAGLLLSVGIWHGLVLWNQAQWHESQSLAIADSRILESVEPASENSSWYVEHATREHVESYVPGDVIRVTKGKLELTYTHGTQVVLHAPAAYELLTSMKARIVLGRLTATVPEAAKGFSVLTPRATVIDLGTQFGVEVNSDSSTNVVVFKGEVDVDYNDKTEQANAQRLKMGEAVHLDALGTASRIVSVNGRSYSDNALESLSRPAIISAVHDNIVRSSSLMSYYEIVHQGMQEDSLAFVDRVAHQWNGVDAKGMPYYLVGADYVKTFNSDKFNQDLELSVHLDAPCKLYVLFDNRHQTPAWLKRDFRDTGDDIGLDTGPFQTTQTTGTHWHNQGPSGVGPGESVEGTLSVWVKVVAEPGVVFLGSTEATVSQHNMYGIAAAPLDAL